MNLLAGLCGLALLASTGLPSVPIKTEASVGTEVTKETLQSDFCDLSLNDMIDFTFESDTKKMTEIKLRLQYRIPKKIYSPFLEEEPETIFGVGIFLVDPDLSTSAYNRRGVYSETFDKHFEEELGTNTFMALKCGPGDYAFVGEDLKAIDSKYASYIQYAKVFVDMLGKNETREVACFAFMESSGTLAVTSTEITSVKKIAEEYVSTGKRLGEDLPEEAMEALCQHFDLERPWHQNFFQILFSNPGNWKTPQWITVCVTGVVFLLIIFAVVFGKK